MVAVLLLYAGDQHRVCPQLPGCHQARVARDPQGRRPRVSEPKRVAQLLVDQGYAKRYDYALQALSEIRYDVWRDYDPEDTLRFYALRLHEASLIQSSPNKLIAEHTDWRFLDELKRELKA